MVGQCDKEGRDKSEDQVGERPDLYPLCTVGQPGRQSMDTAVRKRNRETGMVDMKENTSVSITIFYLILPKRLLAVRVMT